jgi:hypothetical protein
MKATIFLFLAIVYAGDKPVPRPSLNSSTINTRNVLLYGPLLLSAGTGMIQQPNTQPAPTTMTYKPSPIPVSKLNGRRYNFTSTKIRLTTLGPSSPSTSALDNNSCIPNIGQVVRSIMLNTSGEMSCTCGDLR